MKEQEEKEEQSQRLEQQQQVIAQLEEDLRRTGQEKESLVQQRTQETAHYSSQRQISTCLENEADAVRSQLASVKKQKKQLEKALQEKFSDIQQEIQEEKSKRARLKHKYLELQ